MGDGTPRRLNERTGRHVCIRCLAAVDAETYLRNDHICDACAAAEAQPPEPKAKKKKDER